MSSARSLTTVLVLGTALTALTGACGATPPDRPFATNLGHDVGLPAEVRTLVARVARGMTLSSLLHAHEVAEQEVAALVTRAGAVFDVRALRTDRPYRIVQAIGGALRRFEYEIDGDRVLTVTRTDTDDFVAAIDPIEKRTEQTIVNGAIDRDAPSLFAALTRTGERVELSMALADVLRSEVDFDTELQPGDHFDILVDKQFRDADDEWAPPHGEAFAGYGAIQAARFVNNGRTILAVRFTPADGSAGYFDGHGRSLKRFFLKSPLKFDPVVTSRFISHRQHPVLGFTRAHLGVDFRAPTGAPVVAVADGLVVAAAVSGGSGRMIHLRHANGLETQYLHLSAFKVRAGTRVHQGDVIGLVGETGLVTGPHLDYRVRKDGTYVDPVAVHQAMPPGDPVSSADMPAFVDARDRAFETLGIRSGARSDTN